MIRLTYILLFLCFSSTIAFSQTDEEKFIREGNKQYKQHNYTDAGKFYLNAIHKKPDSYKGAFNLGDAYYKQGKYKEAAQQFEMLSARKSSNDSMAKIFHNLGNSYLKQKEYEKSVNAYKNAMKKDDRDEDTRYNLAYAQKMLKQQQQQNKDKQDQNKKDKDNKDKDKNNKDKQNQDKDKQDQNKEQDKNENKKQEQPQNDNISKEDAQRLLDAINNDEKDIRDKMNEKKVKVKDNQIEKDW